MKPAAALIILAALAAGGVVYWMRDVVCVEIPDEDLNNFQPKIEMRTEEAKPGVRTFQQRNGHWHQCKTRLDRAGFM